MLHPNTSIVRFALPMASCAVLTLGAIAQTWSGVRVLEPNMGSSSPPEIPVVAGDALGHVVAAWTSPAMGVAFSERYPGAEWSVAASLLPAGTDGFAPQIALGASGVVAVSWIVPGTEFVPAKLVVSVRPVGGTFSSPAVIVSGAYVFDSELGVAANGCVTAVWAAGGAIKTTSRNPAGAWFPVSVLSASGTSVGLLDLAMNDAGAAVVTWQETASGGTGPTAIRAAYRPSSVRSRWWPAETISSGSGLATWNPKAGIDADGDVAVGYLDGHTLVVARQPAAGGWSAPQPVSPPSDQVYYPALAMDSAGNIALAWQALDGSNYGTISERVLSATGQLSAVNVLSTSLEDASWPMVSISRDGSIAAVTWCDNSTLAARVALGPLRGDWTDYTIGSVWWNTSIPIVAESVLVAAVWPAPTSNPNVTRMVANVYTP